MAFTPTKEIRAIITCPCEREKKLPKTFTVDLNSLPQPAELTCPYCEKLIQVQLPHATVEDGTVLRGILKA